MNESKNFKNFFLSYLPKIDIGNQEIIFEMAIIDAILIIESFLFLYSSFDKILLESMITFMI